MSTRLRVDGTNGRVAIYDVTTAGVEDDAPLETPLSHLDRIRYHSDLDYFEIAAEYSGTLNIPATASPSLDDAPRNHLVTTHGLGFVPYGILMINGSQMSPFEPVYYSTDGRSMRNLGLVVTSTQFYVREYQNIDVTFLPAQSFTIQIYLFATAPTNTTTRLVDIDPTSGRVILGRGQIDNTSRYLKEKAAPDFYMTAGRTVDSWLNSWKVIRPNGTTYTYLPSVYAGSFTAPATIGVGD